MFLSRLGSSVIFEQIFSKKFKKIIILFLVAMAIFSLTKPPVFYRCYYKNIYDIAAKIGKEYPNKKIRFLTNNIPLNVLSPNFNTEPSSIEFPKKDSNIDLQFLIVEKEFFKVDPILSQKALSIDKDLSIFNNNEKILKQKQQRMSALLTS